MLYFHRLNKQEQHASTNYANYYYERVPTTLDPDMPGSISVPRLKTNIVDTNKLGNVSLRNIHK